MEKKSLEAVKEFSADKFTKRILFKKEDSTSFVLHFNAGQSLPSHKHPGTNVYLLVLEGSGTMTVDGVKTELLKDDAVCLEGEETFSFDNTGAGPARLYVVLNKIPSESYATNI